MAGQGSPLTSPGWHWRHGWDAVWDRLCRAPIAGWLAAFAFIAAHVSAEDVDLRLRMTWGEGQRRQWRGSITLSEGTLTEPQCLGVQADAPDDISLERNRLQFIQRIPVAFDGLDFRVEGPTNASLTVDIAPLDDKGAAKRLEVRLADFIPPSAASRDLPLDEQKNQLQLQRAPGDWLRVRFDRDSLVFSPGEEFVFEAVPNALGIPAGTALRCTVQLMTPDENNLWREQFDLHVDQQGAASTIGPIKVPLPEQEGVYEILVSLMQRRLVESIGIPSRVLMQRKIELVVVDPRPITAESPEWTLVEEIDSTNPRWWAKWVWLPPLKLPGVTSASPLGDQKLRVREQDGLRWKEIGPAGWHAATIPIAQVDEPHILEVEFPASARQTMSISVLEPDAVGLVGTQGMDTGVDVAGIVPGSDGMERHRLIFWPRTKSPWLLLTNRRDDLPAVFGKLRVYAGPVVLPPAKTTVVPNQGHRLSAAFLDKPLFATNFGAPEALDGPSNRSLTDWQTFYLGAIRFAEYLKHTGYNAAFVPVASDGMTLYPSRLLDTIPKYDTGTFFSSGQDPIPKDVLELLLRIFDREGLTLIPQIQFAGPLPELEALIRSEDNAWGGVRLIGAVQGKSDPSLGRDFGVPSARRGLAPYYNPLHAQVQLAMRHVVQELVGRCASHTSFGGLSLQLVPFGYGQFPDDSWGLDDTTYGHFAQELRLRPPAAGTDPFASRLALVRGDVRDAWLKWRASKLSDFYKSLQLDVAQSKSNSRLYLDVHDLMAGRIIQSSMRPQLLPDRDEFKIALLRHGIQSSSFDKSDQIVMLRPHRAAPLISLPAQASNLELDQSVRVDEFFQSMGLTGTLLYHEPQVARLPGFDQASPFGAENTYTRLTAHIQAAGPRSRAQLVRDLVAFDTPIIAVGGWMVPLGREDVLSPVLQVVGGLPAEKFADVRPRSARESVPQVAVRTFAQEGKTYVYVANATSLRASVHLELENIPRGATPQILPPLTSSAVTSTSDTAWTARLEPYGLVAFLVPSPKCNVSDWRVEFNADDVQATGRLVEEVRSRLTGLEEPRPLAVLENPGFELPLRDNQIPGWTLTKPPGAQIELDQRIARSGQKSLRMRVDRLDKDGIPGRVRSNRFPLPRSGRVSFKARLRTNDANRQPPLRLALEGVLVDGTPFSYLSQPLGVPVPLQWPDKNEEFVFHLANLPAGTAGHLSIGFDLLGPGEVWIDDVEVFDMYFQVDESKELHKQVWSARQEFTNGKVATCERFLQGYWPQFVLEFGAAPKPVPQPTVPTSTTASTTAPTENQKTAPVAPPERRKWLNPLKLFSR